MKFIIDRHFQKNTDEYGRALHFAVTLVGVIFMLIFFSFLSQGSKIYAPVSFLPIIFMILLVLLVFYLTGNLGLSVNIICLGILLTLFKPTIQTGGVSSQFFLWAMTTPLCGLTLGSLKKGKFWFVATVIYQISIYLYDKTELSDIYNETDKLIVLLNFIFFQAVIMATLIKLEIIQQRKKNIIQKQLDDITYQTDVLKQKNTELERFAFAASHDLRTPLRNVISFASLLSRKLKNISDPDTQLYMSFIKDYAFHMSHIVDNILEFARIGKEEHARIEIVDLEDIKNIVLKSLNDKIEERNAVVYTEGVLPKVNGDRTQLIQLMQNLVENAITYNENPQPEITIGVKEENPNEMFIYVKDNGIGIDAEYQEKVFEMFTRLHSLDKYKGTGLGLAICKKIVIQYGGRIWIDSALEKGTTVNFILPIAA